MQPLFSLFSADLKIAFRENVNQKIGSMSSYLPDTSLTLTSQALHFVQFLEQLRESILQTFMSLETNKEALSREKWMYEKGQGGGEMGLIRGDVFEKAAVNFSAVSGDTFPLQDAAQAKGAFFATGISLITHMYNPYAPTVHFNIRYIETEKGYWFGGGYDLTPMLHKIEEDTEHFHSVAKESLDSVSPHFYPLFSKQAKEYFFNIHWKEERGVGGIFFDHFNSGSFLDDLALVKAVGESFLKCIMPIYEKRIPMPFTQEEKKAQNYRRARYVEFNLLYDRGTQFGLKSGGNPKAIFCSLPPNACW